MSVRLQIGAVIPKAPWAITVYEIDWSAFLGARTIAASTWRIDGPDATLEVDDNSVVSGSTLVTLSGGTLGARYTVTNYITMDTDERDARSFYIDTTLQ